MREARACEIQRSRRLSAVRFAERIRARPTYNMRQRQSYVASPRRGDRDPTTNRPTVRQTRDSTLAGRGGGKGFETHPCAALGGEAFGQRLAVRDRQFEFPALEIRTDEIESIKSSVRATIYQQARHDPPTPDGRRKLPAPYNLAVAPSLDVERALRLPRSASADEAAKLVVCAPKARRTRAPARRRQERGSPPPTRPPKKW